MASDLRPFVDRRSFVRSVSNGFGALAFAALSHGPAAALAIRHASTPRRIFAIF